MFRRRRCVVADTPLRSMSNCRCHTLPMCSVCSLQSLSPLSRRFEARQVGKKVTKKTGTCTFAGRQHVVVWVVRWWQWLYQKVKNSGRRRLAHHPTSLLGLGTTIYSRCRSKVLNREECFSNELLRRTPCRRCQLLAHPIHPRLLHKTVESRRECVGGHGGLWGYRRVAGEQCLSACTHMYHVLAIPIRLAT